MQNIKFAFILILLIPITAQADSIDLSDAAYQVYYSKYNAFDQEWTNMTIIGNHYIISSDNFAYDGLESDFLMNPWDMIAVELDNSNFFESTLMEENPHTVLEINYFDESNILSISQADIGPDGIIPLIDNIFYRVTGYTEEFRAWPIDMQVHVMESYPEQYGVVAKFQRGINLLEYARHMENVTLIVSTYNVFEEPITSDDQVSAIYMDTEMVIIDEVGKTVEISYKTFTLGKDFSPSKLHITILMDNGPYLHYQVYGSDLPSLKLQGYDNIQPKLITFTVIEDNDTESEILELPIPITFMITALLLLPIIRKKILK